ncbi:MAG: hypothetical protein ACKOIA_00220, partial [Acidimicrobiia bacterium]
MILSRSPLREYRENLTQKEIAMASSCCSTSPVAKSHLDHGLGSAPATVEPAHHARKSSTGDRADLLVVGRIVTNDPSIPSAEAMAVSGGAIMG